MKIRIAKSGTFLQANGVDKIQLLCPIEEKEVPVIIRNVFSVPNLEYNLLPIQKLKINGF